MPTQDQNLGRDRDDFPGLLLLSLGLIPKGTVLIHLFSPWDLGCLQIPTSHLWEEILRRGANGNCYKWALSGVYLKQESMVQTHNGFRAVSSDYAFGI